METLSGNALTTLKVELHNLKRDVMMARLMAIFETDLEKRVIIAGATLDRVEKELERLSD